MSTEVQESPELLHAKTQVGYLLLKLKGEDVLSKEETRTGMETLFPNIITKNEA